MIAHNDQIVAEPEYIFKIFAKQLASVYRFSENKNSLYLQGDTGNALLLIDVTTSDANPA